MPITFLLCSWSIWIPLARAGVLIGSDCIASGPNAYSRLVQIDPATGQTTVIGDLNDSVISGLAWDPNHDVLYGFSNATFRVVRIDPNTAHVTPIGPLPGSAGPFQGLEYDSTHDKLYATYTANHSLYSINTATSEVTLIGPYGNAFARSIDGLAYDPVRQVMYGASQNLGSDQEGGGLFTLDLQTGAGTFVGHYNAGSNFLAESLAYDSTLGLFATDTHGADFTFDNELYKIDPATGAATLVGPMGKRNVIGLAFIPEPSAAIMTGFSLLLPVARRTRRKGSCCEAAGRSARGGALTAGSSLLT